MPVGKGSKLNISFFDIDFIDILKGPKAAIYGSRGAGGIIAVYTKVGLQKNDNRPVNKGSQISFIHPGLKREKNMVYWNPSFSIKKGTSQLPIKLLKIPGNYVAILQGTNKEGKFFTSKVVFELKQ